MWQQQGYSEFCTTLQVKAESFWSRFLNKPFEDSLHSQMQLMKIDFAQLFKTRSYYKYKPQWLHLLGADFTLIRDRCQTSSVMPGKCYIQNLPQHFCVSNSTSSMFPGTQPLLNGHHKITGHQWVTNKQHNGILLNRIFNNPVDRELFICFKSIWR